jgi:hypothetical protein
VATQQERSGENGLAEPLLHANARPGSAGIAICFEQPNRRIRDPYVRVVWEGASVMGLPIPIRRRAQRAPENMDAERSERRIPRALHVIISCRKGGNFS